VECGAVLDELRSCYSTLAVNRPGQAAVPIHWWFTDAGAPVAPRHQWGSLNWSKPHYGQGELGEVIGAKRTWRNGSKPAGACGGGIVTGCRSSALPLTLYCYLLGGSSDIAVSLTYDGTEWVGTVPLGVNFCTNANVSFGCYGVQGTSNSAWEASIYWDEAGGRIGEIFSQDRASGTFDPLDATWPVLTFGSDCLDTLGPFHIRISETPVALDRLALPLY